MNTEKTTPVTAIVLGASGRGKLYGDYSLEHPEDLAHHRHCRVGGTAPQHIWRQIPCTRRKPCHHLGRNAQPTQVCRCRHYRYPRPSALCPLY